MKTNEINQFIKSKQLLSNRRKVLQAELDKIDEVLNGTTNGHIRSALPARARTTQQNTMSLREAVTAAVKRKPLSKSEILAAVQAGGYRFSTKDPANSLSALLYKQGSGFTNHGGKFSAK